MAHFNDFLTRIDLSGLKNYIETRGKKLRFNKGENIVLQGEFCRGAAIVVSGYFKFCAINSKGDEIITGFSFAGDIACDFVNTFICNMPAATSIVAGCDAVVMWISVNEARQYLEELAPDFVDAFAAILLQEAYNRYLNRHVKTPAERYSELIERCPAIILNLPVKEVASYLGVSRRQMHRIRLNQHKQL